MTFLWFLAISLNGLATGHAFLVRSTFLGGTSRSFSSHKKCCSLTMRDASASYWFRINDRVQVIDDFIKGGVSLRGMQGQVVETWEKCDVDPTCCCAEQVDTNMAVRVEFSASLLTDSTDESSSFFHYFAEDELVKVMDDAKIADANSNQPFNGMSCTAFKLEQLKSSRPRKIASFDPSQLNSDE